MKLVLWEMKKSWLKLPLFAALIMLAALNYGKYKGMYETNGYMTSDTADMKTGYYEYCENNLFGEITADKLTAFKNDYNTISSEIKNGTFNTDFDENSLTGYAYSDYTLFEFFIKPELEYAVTYGDFSDKVVRRAYENALFYSKKGNKSDESVSRYIYALYKGRSVKAFVPTGWVKDYFKYDFSSLLVVIMIVMGLSPAFSAEYENGMDKMIVSLGKSEKTANAKLLSAVVYILFLTVSFTVFDLFAANHFIKVRSLFAPLYYSEFFKSSPFKFSLFTAVIVCAGLRLLIFLYIGGITLTVSRITKNSVITVALMFGIITVLIALTSKSVSIFNPVNVLSAYKFITEFDCTVIFGKPVLMLYITVILYAVLCIFAAAAIKILTRNGVNKRNA